MPRPKKICPFTDKPCNDCRALFAEERGETFGEKTLGCHLIQKTRAGSNN
jgi:hypothetical protein